MKAITINKYGPPEVLKLNSIERPTPKSDEVLVKLYAIPIATEDPLQRKGKHHH